MKKFLFQAIILLVFVICGLTIIEILARNSFDSVRYKYEWLKEHADEVETIVLGPSSMYYGVNPALFSSNAFSLAFPQQPPKFDWLMFNADTSKMSNLKTVVLDVVAEYMNYELANKDIVPYKLYCPDMEGLPSSPFMFEFSNMVKCKDKIKSHYLKHYGELCCSEKGWGAKKIVKTHEQLISNSIYYANDRKFLSEQGNCSINYPEILMDYCNRHNIKIILVRTPVYWKYKELQDENIQLSDKIEKLANYYLNKYPVAIYKDYSGDSRFVDSDFNDAIHLNLYGADKWSKILKDDFNL